eukprot:13940035-Alexandrium_andersonii.AAC.1
MTPPLRSAGGAIWMGLGWQETPPKRAGNCSKRLGLAGNCSEQSVACRKVFQTAPDGSRQSKLICFDM